MLRARQIKGALVVSGRRTAVVRYVLALALVIGDGSISLEL